MDEIERIEPNQNGLQEEELELSLGLRPSTTRRLFHPKTEASADLTLTTPPILESEKKEVQTIRRQEARKKREEKRNQRRKGDRISYYMVMPGRRSSPGVSDYRSTSAQGGSSSDGGSQSSQSQPLEPKPEVETEPSPTPNPSKPPKAPAAAQQTNNNEAMLLSQMPYVSTTGNGPNGKTVTGFLYKYTNIEVCIVCVCHGTSFTPAAFVEHAGGVDVVNPLRHITVVPFAFT